MARHCTIGRPAGDETACRVLTLQGDMAVVATVFARRGWRCAPVPVLAMALLAGCGPAAAPSPSATGAVSATPSSGASATPSGACGGLTVDEAPAQSFTGHTVVRFDIHNGGTATCDLNGYFTVQLLDSGGAPLQVTEEEGDGQAATATPAPVGVAPGGSAMFLVEVDDVGPNGGTGCPTATSAQLTPPGGATSMTVTLHIQLSPCGSTFSVGAVTPSQ